MTFIDRFLRRPRGGAHQNADPDRAQEARRLLHQRALIDQTIAAIRAEHGWQANVDGLLDLRNSLGVKD